MSSGVFKSVTQSELTVTTHAVKYSMPRQVLVLQYHFYILKNPTSQFQLYNVTCNVMEHLRNKLVPVIFFSSPYLSFS